MSDQRKSHFWIPDEEVVQVSKKLTGRSKPRDIIYSEHGVSLSKGLKTIKQALESTESDNSLKDTGLCVFKVELPEGEKIQDKPDLFSKNGMHVNAVKDERRAIVTTTKQQFQVLKNRVNAYTEKGTNKTHFDYIENFSPYIGNEKNSSELKKRVYIERPPELVDIQLMFIPNLQSQEYALAMELLKAKIHSNNGSIQQEPYYLSDNTPVVRVIIPASTLRKYENDSAIYRIEETRFFSTGVDECIGKMPSSAKLNDTIDIESLPIVAVLDSGVKFIDSFEKLIVQHWTAPLSSGGDCDHGTRVASKVAFSNLGKQISDPEDIEARARIIDCNILDGSVPENIFIQRIQAAVETYSDITKIFNLSANSSQPIEGDEMSIIGFELDALQIKKEIQFVVSAGNHELWKTETSLDDILDDDDSRIAAPADSMLSIVVGSVSYETHLGSLSGKNMVTSYSRRGPGFGGFSKPDMSAYGGSIAIDNNGINVPPDAGSLVMTSSGNIEADAGTSFTSPTVAGDLAEILSITPSMDVLLAKALLYHNALPLWEYDTMDDEELFFTHNLYGRGLSSVTDSKFSTNSKVTFVRTGLLNRETKERVKIFMPEILAAQVGRNVAKVTVTCVSKPPVDRTKGTEYLGAYIRASLKKAHPDGHLIPVSQDFKEGRRKWDACHQFSKTFSDFNSGDWQVWLELFGRWDEKSVDVPYALVVTIEDISKTLDVYSEIEALNRYRALNTLRLKIDV